TLEVLVRKQTERAPTAGGLVSGLPGDLDALCGQLLEAVPVRRIGGAAPLARLGVSAAPAPGRMPSRGRAPPRDAPTLSARAGPRVSPAVSTPPISAVRLVEADGASSHASSISVSQSAAALSQSSHSLAALERASFVGRERELTVLAEAFQRST